MCIYASSDIYKYRNLSYSLAIPGSIPFYLWLLQDPDPYEQLEGQSEDEALEEIQLELDEDNHDRVQEAAAAMAEAGEEQDVAMKPADTNQH